MLTYLLIAALASLFMGVGLLMMKSHAARLPVATGRKILRSLGAWLSDPVWLGGLVVQMFGFALYLFALAQVPVSMTAVMMEGGTGIFVVLAVIVLGERATAAEWIGIVATLLGMILLATSLSSEATEGTLSVRALVILAVIAIGLAALPGAASRFRKSGAAAAIMSGAAFGLGSLFSKAMTIHFLAHAGSALVTRVTGNPFVYLVVVADCTGIVLLQNSFHSARGIIAMPLSGALSNVVPILGGIIAFGERLPADPRAAAMRIAAFTLTIAASAMLAGARGPAAGDRLPVRAEEARSDDARPGAAGARVTATASLHES